MSAEAGNHDRDRCDPRDVTKRFEEMKALRRRIAERNRG